MVQLVLYTTNAATYRNYAPAVAKVHAGGGSKACSKRGLNAKIGEPKVVTQERKSRVIARNIWGACRCCADLNRPSKQPPSASAETKSGSAKEHGVMPKRRKAGLTDNRHGHGLQALLFGHRTVNSSRGSDSRRARRRQFFRCSQSNGSD